MDTNMNNIELQNAIVTKSYYSREELAAFIENQKTKNLVESGIYNSKESKVDVEYRNSLQVRVNNSNPFIMMKIFNFRKRHTFFNYCFSECH